MLNQKIKVDINKAGIFLKPVEKRVMINRPRITAGKFDNINSYRGNLRGNWGYAYKQNLMGGQLYIKPNLRPQSDMRCKDLKYYSSYKSSGNPMMMGGRLISKDSNHNRNYNVEERDYYGSGIIDSGLALATSGASKIGLITNALDIAKQTGQIAYDIYGSEKATKLKNLYTKHLDKNPEAKTGFLGERHIVLPTDYGWSMGNWCGPHTNIEERLKRGDVGVDGLTGIDSQCKKHDLEYNKAKTVKDIRNADTNLVNNIKSSTGNSLMKKTVVGLMKAKMLGEDVGILDPKTITNFPNMEGGSLKSLLKMKNNSNYEGLKFILEKKKKKIIPGDNLRKKLSKKYY